MPVRYLILFLLLSPAVLNAKQEQDDSLVENDLELFEFLAMYDKNDVEFIDAEIEDKNEPENVNDVENKSEIETQTGQQVKTSVSDE